jgi:hypothetical protein
MYNVVCADTSTWKEKDSCTFKKERCLFQSVTRRRSVRYTVQVFSFIAANCTARNVQNRQHVTRTPTSHPLCSHVRTCPLSELHSQADATSFLVSISGVPSGGRGVGGSNPPSPKFRSFDKAEPNSQFGGKYIRNCLVFLFHLPN